MLVRQLRQTAAAEGLLIARQIKNRRANLARLFYCRRRLIGVRLYCDSSARATASRSAA